MNRHSILIFKKDQPLKRAPSTQMKCGECATKVTRIRLLCDYPLSRRASLILSCLLQLLILSAPSFHLVCSNFSPCLLHLFIKPKPNLTFNILMSSDHQTLHKYPVEWPTIPYNKGRQTTAVSFAQKYNALYNVSFSSVLTILFALWHLKSPPESQSCTTTFTQMVSHSAYVYVWGICWTFGGNG